MYVAWSESKGFGIGVQNVTYLTREIDNMMIASIFSIGTVFVSFGLAGRGNFDGRMELVGCFELTQQTSFVAVSP